MSRVTTPVAGPSAAAHDFVRCREARAVRPLARLNSHRLRADIEGTQLGRAQPSEHVTRGSDPHMDDETRDAMIRASELLREAARLEHLRTAALDFEHTRATSECRRNVDDLTRTASTLYRAAKGAGPAQPAKPLRSA